MIPDYIKEVTDTNIIKSDIYLKGHVLLVNSNMYLEVYERPFGNCQIWSIAWMNVILRHVKEEHIKVVIHRCWLLIKRKNLLLIDINNAHVAEIAKLFSDFKIVFTTPYTSTNGSHMTLIGINTGLVGSPIQSWGENV